MAITEEEKRTIRAYNIGYAMSTYEPKLLDKLIKANPNNEFVRAMAVGRDHQEFHANIRKDYSTEYKNGFYNGRILAENSPEMLNRLLSSDTVSRDFKEGLNAANKEFSVNAAKYKMRQETIKKGLEKQNPKLNQMRDNAPHKKQLKKDKGFDR